MKHWKQYIPSNWKRQLKLWLRAWRDRRTGQARLLMRPSLAGQKLGASLPARFSLRQPIRQNAFSENKKHNLRLAIATLQNQVVQPGEIFSFWELVGPPTEKRGYQAGRAIQGGSLSAEVGGGLCQLAGILHYLALQAGWEIVERFPHSLDLYTEESRYAPLGADAAVAYGYKDLRLRNPHDSPGCFRLEVLPDALVATYCGEFPQQVFPVEFVMEAKENGKKVRTRRMASPEQWEEVGQSFYGNYQGKGLN